jgi:kynureninase
MSEPDEVFARLRAEFSPPAGQIYLDGNSLGLPSRRAEAAVHRVLQEWRDQGIGGWMNADPPWLELADRAAVQTADLIGASPAAVAVSGQTTSNLHQLLATLFDPSREGRRCLLGDTLNFASDTYALHSHLRLRRLDPSSHLRLVASSDGYCLDPDRVISAFTPDVQIAVLPAVLFTSGQLLDVRALTAAAQARGIMVGWDLSHSIGVVPHTLEEDGVDFAFWCNYKYVGGGPGAVGGMYLHPRHFSRDPGLAGWWGMRPDRRFAMPRDHEPAVGAAALHIGTPHILSLAPVAAALELYADAGGIGPVRERSLQLTHRLLGLVDQRLARHGFKVVTPRAASNRGGHIALTHPEAWRITQAWRAEGVVADWRSPDLMRLAPSPFFTTPEEIDEAVGRLEALLGAGRHLNYSREPALVP